MQMLSILRSIFVPKIFTIPWWGGQNLALFLSYINILIGWVWILNIQIPIFLRLHINILTPDINTLGKILIFWGKLRLFWSQILLLFGIKIFISGLNSGVTSDKMIKKVSKKYILKFWFTISLSQITKYLFD